MDGARGDPPPGGRGCPGGRGAALLAALKGRTKQPGESSAAGDAVSERTEETSSQQSGPVGRGALLGSMSSSRLSTASTSVASMTVGRGALLEKLKVKTATPGDSAFPVLKPPMGRAALVSQSISFSPSNLLIVCCQVASLKGSITGAGSSSTGTKSHVSELMLDQDGQSQDVVSPPHGLVSPPSSPVIQTLANKFERVGVLDKGPIVKKGKKLF